MYREDFLMRQIEGISRTLAKAIFNKEVAMVEIVSEEGVVISEDLLLHRLITMSESGKINEAENILWEELQANKSTELLKTALIFYEKLNTYDDDFLKSNNYSRQEILEGVSSIGSVDSHSAL